MFLNKIKSEYKKISIIHLITEFLMSFKWIPLQDLQPVQFKLHIQNFQMAI